MHGQRKWERGEETKKKQNKNTHFTIVCIIYLIYSSYQMVCLFLLNILKNNLEKTRQGNVYLVFYTDNKYMNSSSKQTS